MLHLSLSLSLSPTHVTRLRKHMLHLSLSLSLSPTIINLHLRVSRPVGSYTALGLKEIRAHSTHSSARTACPARAPPARTDSPTSPCLSARCSGEAQHILWPELCRRLEDDPISVWLPVVPHALRAAHARERETQDDRLVLTVAHRRLRALGGVDAVAVRGAILDLAAVRDAEASGANGRDGRLVCAVKDPDGVRHAPSELELGLLGQEAAFHTRALVEVDLSHLRARSATEKARELADRHVELDQVATVRRADVARLEVADRATADASHAMGPRLPRSRGRPSLVHLRLGFLGRLRRRLRRLLLRGCRRLGRLSCLELIRRLLLLRRRRGPLECDLGLLHLCRRGRCGDGLG